MEDRNALARLHPADGPSSELLQGVAMSSQLAYAGDNTRLKACMMGAPV
jgi:hypothetical protein